MRAVVQRVTEASVTSDGQLVGSVGPGLCVLLGVTHDDSSLIAVKMATKLWNLRIFDDDAGVMNLSLAETSKQILIVSQFTLYGDTAGGRRPSWTAAARPEVAEPLVSETANALRTLGAHVETGRFRTTMQVTLVNDGPVTVIVDL